jgi:hypothetical protein
MIIQIEDYFGNDIVKLNFCLKDNEISKERFKEIEEISLSNGYSVADVDLDEEDLMFVRVQQTNVDNSEEDEKKELLALINDLNIHFL